MWQSNNNNISICLYSLPLDITRAWVRISTQDDQYVYCEVDQRRPKIDQVNNVSLREQLWLAGATWVAWLVHHCRRWTIRDAKHIKCGLYTARGRGAPITIGVPLPLWNYSACRPKSLGLQPRFSWTCYLHLLSYLWATPNRIDRQRTNLGPTPIVTAL